VALKIDGKQWRVADHPSQRIEGRRRAGQGWKYH